MQDPATIIFGRITSDYIRQVRRLLRLIFILGFSLLQDISDPSGTLDGSFAAINQFLLQLVEMTGQGTRTEKAPVLELQFGGILTVTSLSTWNGIACLSIAALLPVDEKIDFFLQASVLASASFCAVPDCEFLWQADENRCVVLCKIAISDLPDERSVMDAIMDTSDHAERWFSTLKEIGFRRR